MFDFDFTGMIGKASAVKKVFDKLIDLDVLENGMDAGFRFYQKEMWEKFLEIFHGSEEAGMFQAATGTGKTEVFKFFIPYLLCNAEANNDKEGKVFGIVCHRHSLINDLNRRMLPILFNKYYDDEKRLHFFKKDGVAGIGLDKDKVKFYIVNSGTVLKDFNCSKEDNESLHCKDLAEDDKMQKRLQKEGYNQAHINFCKKKLVKEVEENRKNGIHSFFICLYQSIGIKENSVVLQKLNFDMIIADEIHALNSMGNEIGTNNLKFFETVKKRFFFTATPQFDARDERYMNGEFQFARN